MALEFVELARDVLKPISKSVRRTEGLKTEGDFIDIMRLWASKSEPPGVQEFTLYFETLS